MYIKVDILKQLGGFETKYWCKDIYMSCVLRNKNISIALYSIMILLEYGSTIKIIEKLTRTIFKGKIKILLSTMLATTISNIGPIYSLISRKKEKYKTVR